MTSARRVCVGFFLLIVSVGAGGARAQSGSESGGGSSASRAEAQSSGEEIVGPYTTTGSVELGVRGVSVDGNADKYRSDLNYDPGFRIFDSSLYMRADDDEGLLFDSLLVTTSGWGRDPSAFTHVNVAKLRAFEFDAKVRRFDYFNSLSNYANKQHVWNNEHKVGDFELELFPERDFSLNAGYSYSNYDGENLTTVDFSRDEFPVIAPARVRSDEFRIGGDVKLGPVNFSLQQGFRYFRDDTSYFIENPQPGNNPTGIAFLDSYRRDLPTRGRTYFTRAGVQALIGDRVDIAGRFIYSSSTSEFSLFETATGVAYTGRPIVLEQISARGDAKRPQSIGDLGVTWLATDRFRVSNTFQVSVFRISGGQDLATTLVSPSPTPVSFSEIAEFRNTRYRRISNAFELDYQFHPRFSAHAGYRYTDRRVELEALEEGEEEAHLETFDNRTNTFFGGLKAKPVKRWTLYLDFEKGESDNVFTRISNYDYTNFRVRSIFRPVDSLTLNLSVVTRDNLNPSETKEDEPREFGADVNSRIYSASADWTPGSRLSVAGGYTMTHVTSEVDVFFYFNFAPKVGVSRYFLRDNFAYLSASAQVHPRVSAYASYRMHVDPGQGDRVSIPAENLLITSYPQQFQTFDSRLTVRVNYRLDLNAGYQYNDFKEKFVNLQHYRAHMPYGSVRFYIGRRPG
jgi:hypothetical protein